VAAFEPFRVKLAQKALSPWEDGCGTRLAVHPCAGSSGPAATPARALGAAALQGWSATSASKCFAADREISLGTFLFGSKFFCTYHLSLLS